MYGSFAARCMRDLKLYVNAMMTPFIRVRKYQNSTFIVFLVCWVLFLLNAFVTNIGDTKAAIDQLPTLTATNVAAGTLTSTTTTTQTGTATPTVSPTSSAEIQPPYPAPTSALAETSTMTLSSSSTILPTETPLSSDVQKQSLTLIPIPTIIIIYPTIDLPATEVPKATATPIEGTLISQLNKGFKALGLVGLICTVGLIWLMLVVWVVLLVNRIKS